MRFDILGLPAVMAVMGKGTEADSLSAFDVDDALLNPDLSARQEFFVNKDYSVADAKDLLQGASARHVYYFGEIIKDSKTVWGQHPACACGIVRERHEASEPESPVQCGFEYSDGTGNVLVSRKPFKVFSWLNRGHYRAGDTIRAQFSAQTLDQKPVQGTGVLKLFAISYDEKNEPVEKAVGTWNVDTNVEGQAHQQIKAAKAGQYRARILSLDKQLTDLRAQEADIAKRPVLPGEVLSPANVTPGMSNSARAWALK